MIERQKKLQRFESQFNPAIAVGRCDDTKQEFSSPPEVQFMMPTVKLEYLSDDSYHSWTDMLPVDVSIGKVEKFEPVDDPVRDDAYESSDGEEQVS